MNQKQKPNFDKLFPDNKAVVAKTGSNGKQTMHIDNGKKEPLCAVKGKFYKKPIESMGYPVWAEVCPRCLKKYNNTWWKK